MDLYHAALQLTLDGTTYAVPPRHLAIGPEGAKADQAATRYNGVLTGEWGDVNRVGLYHGLHGGSRSRPWHAHRQVRTPARGTLPLRGKTHAAMTGSARGTQALLRIVG